jgi:short-subunit dehydrogenase
VNISSIGGHVALPKTAAYAASKWGLRGFGAAIQAENAEHGVRISNVYPSFTDTPMLGSDRFAFASTRTELPRLLVDDPAKVVAALLKGVARGELHIFPSSRSRALAELTRISPGVASLLTRNFWAVFG